MSMKLVERPSRPGFAAEAWDVYNTMENPWLTIDEVHNLLPDTMRRKHRSRPKLASAIQNGVERGMFVFVGESHGNRSDKKYRLATIEHREQMMRKYREKVAKWTSKSESPRAQKPVAKKKATNSQQRSDLVRSIDSKIDHVEQQLAALNEMRRLAMNLGDL